MSGTTKKKRDVQAGLLTLRKRMPALENIFDAFGPLVLAQEKAEEVLADWDGYAIPESYAPRFEQGVALLADMELPELGDKYREVFMLMISAVAEGLPALNGQVDGIVAAIGEVENLNDLAKAIWDEDGKLLHSLVEEWQVDEQILAFVGTLALKPFMVRIEPEAAKAIENMSWQKGYCPVCGTFPDLALLRKSGDDNAYLKSHGGQRWLHCSGCGHEWRFKRNTCPWCENEDHEKMRYLQAEERQNERVDICKKCNHYFVTLDTRELVEQPDPRVAPLGLVHLDIKAQEENYQPLAETPWNVL
ncbi:formate dehydrogenase accessory protein FdhE [Desulfovibrio sp. JC010]|uniref:formate dehydrogenase accessory protein FdhE n=1 Tax=Desulfovibrio sp. JC010 TaxID=2593641 RepID=UPI0013D0B4C5|nr:formate dehydrogenase accessory protein FdhE [Desulfovibrio sp. JC010]NDV26851.1 formate dehydrogenase accessory protein FdhE [Desulfovibrio sp. JC010]